MRIYSVGADSKVAYGDVKGETCLQSVCDEELGGHAWAGIE